MTTKIIHKKSSVASRIPTASDLEVGEIALNLADKKIYTKDTNGDVIELATSSAAMNTYKYTSTSSQTTFSGSDDASATLAYTSGAIIVTVNGVVYEDGTDYTATNGTSIVFTSGLEVNDEVNIIAFTSSALTTIDYSDISNTPTLPTDFVSAASGGTFSGDIDVTGTVTADGLTVDGGATNFPIIVTSADQYAGIAFADDTTTTNAHVAVYADGNNLGFEAGNSERMRIDSSGNVGIGTSSPSRELEVTGSGNVYIKVTAPTANDSAGIELANTGATWLIQNDDTSSEALTFDRAGTERLRITSAGLVGIGTDSPQKLLEIASGNSGGDAALDSPTFRIKNTTESADWDAEDVVGTIEYYSTDASGNSPYVTSFIKSVNEQGNGTLPSGALTFGTTTYNASGGAIERLRIDSSGNVLLGKTSTVINPMGCMLKPNGQIFATTNGSDSFHSYDTSQNRYEFYVRGDGGVANYSSNNINLSDQTEKKNITAAASAWDDIKGLSLKEFNYTFEDNADPKQLGVIAQEVQVNHPDLIKTFKVDNDTDKLGVVEQQITWMAIKALQEAITKIETLETQNADILQRLETLENNNE